MYEAPPTSDFILLLEHILDTHLPNKRKRSVENIKLLELVTRYIYDKTRRGPQEDIKNWYERGLQEYMATKESRSFSYR